jgi:oxygen-independent coproporphyrinogen-3 oxidase
MFVVKISQENYEYDVHALVQSFYPGEQIVVLTPQTGAEKRAELEQNIRLEIQFKQDSVVITTDEKHLVWELGEQYKAEFKRRFYLFLCDETGKTLPWGDLIGIRPTKIAYGLLEEGKSEEEICRHYETEYFVSSRKARLGVEIAKRERELLKDVHYQDGYSLYIGIPFCPTTCLYCSFTSFPIAAYRKVVDDYISCVIKEMEFVAENFKDRILDSVYIGGGTPTTLEAEQLDKLIGKLKNLFDFSTVKEFTVEAGRADSITKEKLEVLHKYGVTRISVNPQTMKQETLDIIGRKASVKQVLEAYALAREVGFDNINMDIILGLPGEEEADVQRTIDEIVKLSPDSLTVHSLAIKRASGLGRWMKEHDVKAMHNTDATMEIAAEGARKLGMVPYYLYRQKNMSGNFENVGYARPGKLGLYNILIMEEMQSIIALGAGSISKKVTLHQNEHGQESFLIERCENVKDVKLYIESIEEMIERKRALFL